MVREVLQLVFENGEAEVSLFAVATRSRFDVGHALGYLAGTIGSSDYSSGKQKRYLEKLASAKEQLATPKAKANPVQDGFGVKGGAFLFPSRLLVEPAAHTPHQCTTFYPAAEYHWDAPKAGWELSVRFLNGLRSGEVMYSLLREPDVRAQAAIAMSECHRRFGNVLDGPPPAWRDGSLPSSEQLRRLRMIAGELGFVGQESFH